MRLIYAFPCLLLAFPPPATALVNGPLRAAYQFQYGMAYSAAADLPAYQIIDLGRDVKPIDVNDALTVLLVNGSHQLIRWTGGNAEVLMESFYSVDWADLNESNSVASVFRADHGEWEILFWEGMAAQPRLFPWGHNRPLPPYYLLPYAFNDANQIALRTEAESQTFALPPYTIWVTSDLLTLSGGIQHNLAAYEYHLSMDFSLHRGGMLYEVTALNNYGESAGTVYEDEAYSPAYSNEEIITFQNEYFAYNRDTAIDFEPLQLTDAGTIVGRTLGPVFRMVIQDSFGQRDVSGALSLLAEASPRMSNPAEGMEEIVLGNHYWKRMSERDLTGRPTGQPSPDFFEGSLEDLIRDPGPWSSLQATAISANGRIVGTGMLRNPVTGSLEEHGFLLLPQALLPDWDRDGRIDHRDHAIAAGDQPWRLWINDDDDHGDLARSSDDDLPGRPEPDCLNPGVDGLRDAVDFFPLSLDLQSILQNVPNLADVEVVLSQADGALNFTYADLHPAACGEYLRGPAPTGYGPQFADPLAGAGTATITPAGVPVEAAFLEHLKTSGRGILLIEANKSTDKPLVMEYRYKGNPVFGHELPLSTSPVRDMLRVLNLRECDPKFNNAGPGPWTTALGEPPNLPDRYLKRFAYPLRTLVNIHGFNWSGEEAPASHAEVFKRFYQLGSHARFIGISWFGNQGTLDLIGTSFDYNENVINAFITAAYLAESLAPFSGSFTSVFAHSLGNMVASSAITDFGLEVANYFALNAAVAVEAYLGEQANRRLMVHPQWKDTGGVIDDYGEHLLAANWHQLFPAEDHRSQLRWKSRFGNLTKHTICHNFYSSGEDILRAGNGDLPNLLQHVWKKELIWTYNEMVKGTTALATSLTGDTQAGWGFNREYMVWNDPGGAAHPPAGQWVPMKTISAEALTPEHIIRDPFFRPFSNGDPDFPLWFNGGWLYQDTQTANTHLPPLPFSGVHVDIVKNHAKILAEAIPGHSAPAGTSPMPNIPLLGNYDLDEVFRNDTFWPERSDSEKRNRWLHGDYKNPALSYVAGLFQTCIESINYIP